MRSAARRASGAFLEVVEIALVTSAFGEMPSVARRGHQRPQTARPRQTPDERRRRRPAARLTLRRCSTCPRAWTSHARRRSFLPTTTRRRHHGGDHSRGAMISLSSSGNAPSHGGSVRRSIAGIEAELLPLQFVCGAAIELIEGRGLRPRRGGVSSPNTPPFADGRRRCRASVQPRSCAHAQC